MADLDLTPRTADAPIGRSGRRRVLPLLVGLVVVAGIAFALFQTLSDASLFFYNVDEAVAERTELGDARFRIQGTPIGDTIESTVVGADTAVTFSIAFDGVEADVVHIGDPPDLFQPGVPVVMDGAWVTGVPDGVESFTGGANDGYYFASDRILVKHDENYTQDNGERLDEAEEGGAVPVDQR